MISILIVDDDINKISCVISSILHNYSDQVEIRQASNVQEAIEVLQSGHFHLLITDLLMPIRFGEHPDEKGGENLIKQIYKQKNKVNVPIYIVGLTQFEDIKHNFSAVWKVWKYDSTNLDWKNKLRDLILHISRINSKIVKEKKETIFVEGRTDKDIIDLAMKLFFEEFINKLSIETINSGAGSSWVERQLIIWGKTLFWKDKEKTRYLKAVGLFDCDDAGVKSIQSVNKQILENSAEKKTFTIIKLDRKYAKHLIPIYTKGLILPITLEEMYTYSCWVFAKKQNWLVDRVLSESILKDQNKWDKDKLSLRQYINTLNLSDEDDLFVRFKFKDDCKTSLVQYLKGLDVESQKQALAAFQPLIYDILIKLKLINNN